MSNKLLVNCLALSKCHARYPNLLQQAILIRNYSAKPATAAAVVDQKQPSKSTDKPSKKLNRSEKPVESNSFVLNLFRGQMKLDEVFPYPVG